MASTAIFGEYLLFLETRVLQPSNLVTRVHDAYIMTRVWSQISLGCRDNDREIVNRCGLRCAMFPGIALLTYQWGELGTASISDNTSFVTPRKVTKPRQLHILVQSFWNLTDAPTALLPNSLSNSKPCDFSYSKYHCRNCESKVSLFLKA